MTQLLKHKSYMRIFLVMMLLCVGLSGCDNSTESKTAHETSADSNSLEEKVSFLAIYGFGDRRYEQLEYDVWYQDNSGGLVPGPSDWDIKILAVVPSEDIEQWLPAELNKIDMSAPDWLQIIPGNIDSRGVNEWYGDLNSVLVGLDRKTSTIAYRHITR